MNKKPIIPITIFSVSLFGSLILTSIGIREGLFEGNPWMNFLIKIHPVMMWIAGFFVIGFIWVVYLAKREEIKGCYLVLYWILALILLTNFIREIILLFFIN